MTLSISLDDLRLARNKCHHMRLNYINVFYVIAVICRLCRSRRRWANRHRSISSDMAITTIDNMTSAFIRMHKKRENQYAWLQFISINVEYSSSQTFHTGLHVIVRHTTFVMWLMTCGQVSDAWMKRGSILHRPIWGESHKIKQSANI